MDVKRVRRDLTETGEGKSLTMKEWPETERPYEKAEQKGVGELSHAELLAVILVSGRGGRLPCRPRSGFC